jgi:ADP-heptose:LPS heptosyltransferase
MSQPPRSRLRARIRALTGAFGHSLRPPASRRGPVGTILILHHLLLGDTAGLAALMAKCRANYPLSNLIISVPTALMPLFSGRPYGVHAVAFDLKSPGTVTALRECAPHGIDLAIVPGDNRHTVLARAAGARRIVAFAGDRPGWKNWLADQLEPWPAWPFNWVDTAAALIDGPPPPPFRKGDWAVPVDSGARPPLSAPYVVLHPSARNTLRNWQTDKWLTVAQSLRDRGQHVVWSGTDDDLPGIAVLQQPGDTNLAGRTDLAQLWHVLAGAQLLVSVDTGVPHVARLAGCPNVTLFGPGSPYFSGSAQFFEGIRSRACFAPNIACRNQSIAFKRETPGMQRCVRFAPDCTDNICMQAVTANEVIAACHDLLESQ